MIAVDVTRPPVVRVGIVRTLFGIQFFDQRIRVRIVEDIQIEKVDVFRDERLRIDRLDAMCDLVHAEFAAQDDVVQFRHVGLICRIVIAVGIGVGADLVSAEPWKCLFDPGVVFGRPPENHVAFAGRSAARRVGAGRPDEDVVDAVGVDVARAADRVGGRIVAGDTVQDESLCSVTAGLGKQVSELDGGREARGSPEKYIAFAGV